MNNPKSIAEQFCIELTPKNISSLIFLYQTGRLPMDDNISKQATLSLEKTQNPKK